MATDRRWSMTTLKIPLEELLSDKLTEDEKAAIGQWAVTMNGRVGDLEVKLNVVTKALQVLQQSLFLGGA
jgi:hypothetical protein